MMKTVVIPAGGYATRLLPASKVVPKQLLPVPPTMKPVIQVIFEMWYNYGARNFIFIIYDNLIKDYFTPDEEFIKFLNQKQKYKEAQMLREFYEKIENCHITFLRQENRRGFGDAVLHAEKYVNSPFYVSVSDVIVSKIPRMFPINSLLVSSVHNPEQYGVVKISKNNIVETIIEKPSNPPSNLVSVGYYHFTQDIFDALKTINTTDEIQLTDGIAKMIQEGFYFRAVKVKRFYDFGESSSYIKNFIKFSRGGRPRL